MPRSFTRAAANAPTAAVRLEPYSCELSTHRHGRDRQRLHADFDLIGQRRPVIDPTALHPSCRRFAGRWVQQNIPAAHILAADRRTNRSLGDWIATLAPGRRPTRPLAGAMFTCDKLVLNPPRSQVSVSIIVRPTAPRISVKKTGAKPRRQPSLHKTSSSQQNANLKATTTRRGKSKR
jgi:hypothetical protein